MYIVQAYYRGCLPHLSTAVPPLSGVHARLLAKAEARSRGTGHGEQISCSGSALEEEVGVLVRVQSSVQPLLHRAFRLGADHRSRVVLFVRGTRPTFSDMVRSRRSDPFRSAGADRRSWAGRRYGGTLDLLRSRFVLKFCALIVALSRSRRGVKVGCPLPLADWHTRLPGILEQRIRGTVSGLSWASPVHALPVLPRDKVVPPQALELEANLTSWLTVMQGLRDYLGQGT